MNEVAVKRLQSELMDILSNPLEGIDAQPTQNIFEWHVSIKGPPESYYEGGVFKARLIFPNNYPFGPPTLKFTTEIFHPNIYQDGRVCISILHFGVDHSGYESPNEQWNASQTIKTILLSVISLLFEANVNSAANLEAADMWKNNPESFKERIKNIIQKQKENS